MVENAVVAERPKLAAGTFYDKIASLYNLTFKINGYGRSLDKYLRENPLPIESGARILDAGCGTGLLTFSLMRILDFPVRITALDLSSSSLVTAQKSFAETDGALRHEVSFMQGNILSLPFADESFDMIVTSGALEYVPLQEGLREMARILSPGGHLLHLPVRPAPVSKLLELMFRFKIHPPEEVEKNTNRYFRVVSHHRFPPLHVIGWTKSAILARKK